MTERPTFLPWPLFEDYTTTPYVVWTWKRDQLRTMDSNVTLEAPAFTYCGAPLSDITLTATHQKMTVVAPYVFKMFPTTDPTRYTSEKIVTRRSAICWPNKRLKIKPNATLCVTIEAKINGEAVKWDNMLIDLSNYHTLETGTSTHKRRAIAALGALSGESPPARKRHRPDETVDQTLCDHIDAELNKLEPKHEAARLATYPAHIKMMLMMCHFTEQEATAVADAVALKIAPIVDLGKN